MDRSIKRLMEQISASPTAYHAASLAAEQLEESGFLRLEEGEVWQLSRGGRYYVMRNGSALIAFVVGREGSAFRVVASHLDSPCLKLKGNPVTHAGGCAKLNVEAYGGSLLYTWLNVPLQLAGRVILYDEESGRLTAKNVCDPHKLVIPSLAIHFHREANSALALNPQIDLQPIVSMRESFSLSFAGEGERVMAEDIFLTSAAEPFLAGREGELLVAPRIDNLTSAFASVDALAAAGEHGVSLAYLADNEEVGSRTKQGAGSDFLYSVMCRIAAALDTSLDRALSDSFLVSCDNAHAIHPNHPEKSDPTNPVRLGGGVVIKHHANQNYTTDAMSAAIFKAIMEKNDIPYQEFYMRADMPCGGTLGAISSSQVSVRSVDIGLPQLAMHASAETMCAADYPVLVRALSAFFAASLAAPSDHEATVRFP